MSVVKMTVRQIVDLGLWEKVCEYKGWDYYIRREGTISDEEEVEFDTEFKKEIDMYDKPTEINHPEDVEKILYYYHANRSLRWKGQHCGVVFAYSKEDAENKLNDYYSWDNFEITVEIMVSKEMDKEKGVFEIGQYSE